MYATFKLELSAGSMGLLAHQANFKSFFYNTNLLIIKQFIQA